ncbi:hypothetical protein KPH14_013029, partial [Odynerus spinipes]
MSYDLLLGREFMFQPGLTITFNRDSSLNMVYDEPIADVLNIEAIECNKELDIVADDMDSSLPYETKDKLLTLVDSYVHTKDGTGKLDYEFNIELTKDSKPFYFTPRRLSWHERS